MTMRAKFKVDSIERTSSTRRNPETGKWDPCEVRSIKLSAVADGSPENEEFWAATPYGQIDIGVANLDAVAGFELGDEYYVDFTPAKP